MGEYLPGNLQERLRELREANGFATRQDLAKELGIDKSTYGRIESGETKTINSDILIKLSELYNVTSDYILGISDVPEKTYYDIGDLGLSVAAAKNLYTNNASKSAVNALLQNDKFLYATKQMETYFNGVASRAYQACNDLYNFSFDILTDAIHAGRIPWDKDMKELQKGLKARKVPRESFQLTKIQNQVMAAIKEIKKDISSSIKDFAGEQCNASVLKEIRNEMQKYGDLTKYSKEEQKKFIVEMIQNAVKKDSDLTEEQAKEIDKGIETILMKAFSMK